MVRPSFRGRWMAVLLAMSIIPGLVANRPPRHIGPRRAARTTWDSVYSSAQAGRGESAYVKACARCHGASLAGADQSPPLAGSSFLGNWNGLPLSDLHTRIKSTMPSDSVGILDSRLVTDVMAFLLKVNGFPEGARELPLEIDSLKTILLQASRP
jgi:mono/diheme cytochrome c family protein